MISRRYLFLILSPRALSVVQQSQRLDHLTMSSQAKGALVMGSEMLRCAQHDNEAKHDSEEPDYHIAA